ncbi:cytochrome c biogenesis protein [Anaeromyxobacter paludicola]|nr:cytochrome c biogenesis protein CcsA [Anaeromyxobacter paludicola]
MQSLTFWAAVTCYAVASVLFFLSVALRGVRTGLAARVVVAVGLLPHAVSLALRWAEVGHGPYSTRYEVISSNVLVLVAAWLGASALARGLRPLGAFVAPVAFLAMGWAVMTFGVKAEVPIIFKSYWLALHIGFAKLFGMSMMLSAGCAAAYLLRTRPSAAPARREAAARLGRYAHQLLLVAFFLLGVMIAAGALWAHQSWGRYWGWDPIETSSLVTWLVLGMILHLGSLHGWSGRRLAWLNFVALGFAIVTVYVVAMVVPTIHNSYLIAR